MSDSPESPRGGMKPVGATVQKLVRPLLGKHAQAEAEFLIAWNSIMGEELAGLAVPLGITFPKRGERLSGTLTLSCESAAALELQHKSPQILERANRFFGYQAIDRLALRQRGARPTKGAKKP